MEKLVRGAPTLHQKIQVLTTMMTRAMLYSQLGKSYGGARDLYEALGYPTTLTFEQFMAKYIRQDIAKRIINAYPDACWAKPPEIVESAEEDTDFERAWIALTKKMPIWHYFKRADRISGIGHYGALLLGFNDSNTISQPVKQGENRLIYLRPFQEQQTQIKTWVTDPKDERYGLPLIYTLAISQPPIVGGTAFASTLTDVHYSRVLHMAEDLTTDDVYGTPRLEAVYNRLQDLEMIAGGGAEMWWRGAFPGLAMKAVEGADFPTDTAEVNKLQGEIDNYVHGLQRYMRLKGIEIQQLQPQPSDGTKPFEVEITLISVATGIPKRILMGTERGELASSQDTSEWDDRVDERRVNYCAPKVVRPFIDRLIMAGVLPEPKSGYNVVWSPIHIMNEKEKAEIASRRAEAISKYAGTVGSDQVISPRQFLSEIMGFSDDMVELITKETKVIIEEEQAQMKVEQDILAKQAGEAAKAQPAGGRVVTKPAAQA
jgi:uncharacterized protein